jgi:hypothetical protein
LTEKPIIEARPPDTEADSTWAVVIPLATLCAAVVARNRVTLLRLERGLHGGGMVLTGSGHRTCVGGSLLRGIRWTGSPDVRENAERSTDGGRTWTTVSDIVFRPHRPS